MDPNKQPDVVERSKPEFRLGQEAIEGAMVSNKPEKVNTDRESKVKQSARSMPIAINKPLMQCYPEIADDEDEELLADVRKHWIGQLGIIASGVILIILLIIFTVSAPSLLRGISYNVGLATKGIIGAMALFVGILISVGTFITLWIYHQSHMLVTNENVIEVKQINLFSRKVSHLNMINVEDVTVIKKGVLQTALNYGTMSIQTAGEKDNFTFPGTPNPDIYRRLVINAHEDAIDRLGRLGSGQRVEIADNDI